MSGVDWLSLAIMVAAVVPVAWATGLMAHRRRWGQVAFLGGTTLVLIGYLVWFWRGAGLLP